MEMIGPYRPVQRLGACPVGEVWWGIDRDETYASVAILDSAVARDERWRSSFAAAAAALAPPQGDAINVIGSDFAASSPWVACGVDNGPGAAQIFVSLG